ncbi:MAG: hypothetical protein IJU23_09525 [Proteobacteria bacterium]|nr:hypothetical protein [Pseudomonadota bacterium]
MHFISLKYKGMRVQTHEEHGELVESLRGERAKKARRVSQIAAGKRRIGRKANSRDGEL